MESKFEKLLKEALDHNDFEVGSEDLEQNLDYQDGDVNFGGEEETTENDVVGELLSIKDAVEGLLTKLGYEDESEETEDDVDDLIDDEDVGGEDDIEDLEKEAVEYEDVTGKEDELQKKSNQKAVAKVGDLEQETSKKEGQEKNYKFVKVKKPEELKHKTTK